MSKSHLLREDVLAASVVEGGALIDELGKAHGDYLRALARRLCRDQYDPDDLVQDTLLRTLTSPIPEGANVRAWLARIMHNRFIDCVRRRNARVETEAHAAAAGIDDEIWWQALDEGDVLCAVAQLPAEQRDAFTMFAFERKSYAEIAAAQQTAKATVGSRILRARLRIREILEIREMERRDG